MLHGERFASTRLARSVRESIPREAVPAVGRVRFWRREPLPYKARRQSARHPHCLAAAGGARSARFFSAGLFFRKGKSGFLQIPAVGADEPFKVTGFAGKGHGFGIVAQHLLRNGKGDGAALMGFQPYGARQAVCTACRGSAQLQCFRPGLYGTGLAAG